VKTRNGFVSNSSSSSFIIAVRKHVAKKLTKPCKCCGLTHISFLTFMRECCKDYGSSDASELKASDRADILKEWAEYLAWSKYYNDPLKKDLQMAEDMEEFRERLEKYDDKHWDLAWVQISYHDGILKALFDDMVKNKSIEIIENMG